MYSVSCAVSHSFAGFNQTSRFCLLKLQKLLHHTYHLRRLFPILVEMLVHPLFVLFVLLCLFLKHSKYHFSGR